MMAFALGLAAVYMWNGMSIGWDTVSVHLPEIRSADNVLLIFPATSEDTGFSRTYDESDIVNGRELSTYDVRGFVESCEGYDSDKEWSECARKREAARRFVYESWKQKRRGYIQIGHPCTDCLPEDHIFIEPAADGEWRVVVTRHTGGLFGDYLGTEEAAAVKFRRATRDERWRASSKIVLSFLDADGKEINHF